MAGSIVVVSGAPGTGKSTVAEGWWRRGRRQRAVQELVGGVEVFCACEPALAAERARAWPERRATRPTAT